MPSASPGPASPTAFAQILPGAATSSLQTVTTYTYRHKRYIAYISGRQLSILDSPTHLVQILTFAEDLVAIVADSESERLVAAGKENIWVLKPITEGWSRVWWEKTLSLLREDAGDETQSLSWGTEGEVLIGGSRHLSLFSTRPTSRTASPTTFHPDEDYVELRKALWSKPLASPVEYATFSPSGTLIATFCKHDRLVKIWRRLSFEEGLFDFAYLPHPDPVTHLEWRPHEDHTEERREGGLSTRPDEESEVLYTVASDGILRVWKTSGLHDLEILSLHATVDLVSAIPTSPALSNNGATRTLRPARYVFIITSESFNAAVTATLARRSDGKTSHTLEHLKEVVSNAPDIVVTMDGQGHMSAWGLQSIGHKRRSLNFGSEQAFHIAHAEDLLLKIDPNIDARFTSWFDEDKLHLLAHTFDGKVTWWQGSVETIFSPSASGLDHLTAAATWSGHCGHVQKLARSPNSSYLFSWSDDHERIAWIQAGNGQLTPEKAQSSPKLHSPSIDPSDITFETGISNPSVFASNDHFAALVSDDRKELVILNLSHGYIEHRQTLQTSIYYLSCFSSSPGHNILAVGFERHINVLVQPRYEHHTDTPAWVFAKSVSIVGLGLQISDIEWTLNGAIALAVGNGILLTDNKVSTETLELEIRETMDISKTKDVADLKLSCLSSKLRSPLPMWHPDLLSHLQHSGQPRKAFGILHALGQKLKFWSEGDTLSLFENDDNLQIWDDTGKLSDDTISDLMEQLEQKDLPELSNAGQQRLIRVLKAVVYVSEHVNGLDSGALRFLFSWKLQLLEIEASNAAAAEQRHGSDRSFNPSVPEMHWREIAFAYHSTTQQPLVDILTLHYDNKITWSIARALGMTAWISERTALAQVFETLAQTTYRQTSPPDPTTASLYFLALHKKQTLLGLWRIATWHKEQRATTNFLKRDFNHVDAKTAAKKNAYALMGKRRFEYAAAFFLLADDAASAVSLLAGQCEDIMLAVAVARLYGGDDQDVIRKLVDDRLLPQAEESRNRWMVSWCHSLLQQKNEAAAALIKPLEGMRSWWQDDPITLVMYKDLRTESLEHEYEAVLRSAMILRRMGLWSAALELVSEWEFETPKSRATETENGEATPTKTNGANNQMPSMLDDFASLSVKSAPSEQSSMLDDFSAPPPVSDKAAREAKAAELLRKLKAKKTTAGPAAETEKKKPEPTQFKEPDTNSLLDNFGF